MITPIDKLAKVVEGMNSEPWTAEGSDVRAYYANYDHRMAYASTPNNAFGIAALRNVAAELIAVARAANAFFVAYNTKGDMLWVSSTVEERLSEALTALNAAIEKATE